MMFISVLEPIPENCNGIPDTDWGCCTNAKQCTVGEGDCDRDSHCQGDLKCGKNNCQKDFSVLGSNWLSSADCCYGNLCNFLVISSVSEARWNHYVHFSIYIPFSIFKKRQQPQPQRLRLRVTLAMAFPLQVGVAAAT